MRLPENERKATLRVKSEKIDKDFYVWREFALTQAKGKISCDTSKVKNEYILDFTEERDAVLFKLWCL